MNNFEQYMRENYDAEELADMARFGCVNGFPGLTYYTDTTELYRLFDFQYPRADRSLCNNLLVWYAAERVAWQLTENENDEEV